ncbi:MAG: M48 family metalloprotease [Oligoflexia bacterium]|nr:M48 family metalloprotease [Oligoflexia bacterium]
MKKLFVTSILLATFSCTLVWSAFSATKNINNDSKRSIVEENNLYIPVGYKKVSSVTAEIFNQAIADVTKIYAPVVSAKGATLSISGDWNDGTVNAYASRSGKTWKVNLFGGLARHETITPDGFALVICHELGHHLGGAPKIQNYFNSWATNEGQSDYFATLKCLRKYFEKDNNEQVVANLNVPAYVTSLCEQTHSNREDVAICKRGAMAGKSVADLFVVLGNVSKVDFSTPDPTVVSKTNDSHPAAQCRLDTYLEGAVCAANENEDVSDTDVTKGTCTKRNGFTLGLRSRCWYKPTIE